MRVLLIGRKFGPVMLMLTHAAGAPANLADDQHIRIRPVAGTGIAGPAFLAYSCRNDFLPAVLDIAACAPALAVLLKYRPEGVTGMTRQRKDYVTAGGKKRIAHIFHPPGIDRIPVILHIVDTPFRPLAGILSCKGILSEVPERIARYLCLVNLIKGRDGAFFHPPALSVRTVT